MLDKLSKDILRYMTEKENCHKEYNFGNDFREMAQKLAVDENALFKAVERLEKDGYIRYIRVNQRIAHKFQLTQKGSRWRNRRLRKFVSQQMRRLQSGLEILNTLASLVYHVCSIVVLLSP